jgi:putative FmdB family regulatory protein
MPIYEYECSAHGRFDELRSFNQHKLPADCPVCRVACERAVSLPRAPVMSATTVKAMDRNEKSSHAPEVHAGSLTEHAIFKGKARRGHVCAPSCAHGGTSAEERKSQSFLSYKGPRPWVVEHTQGATLR